MKICKINFLQIIFFIKNTEYFVTKYSYRTTFKKNFKIIREFICRTTYKFD